MSAAACSQDTADPPGFIGREEVSVVLRQLGFRDDAGDQFDRLFDRMDGSVNVPARARQIIRNFIGVRISRGCSTLILILFEKLQANSVLSYRFKANFSLMIYFRDLSTVFCSRLKRLGADV